MDDGLLLQSVEGLGDTSMGTAFMATEAEYGIHCRV
jgi:hypothetical protein